MNPDPNDDDDTMTSGLTHRCFERGGKMTLLRLDYQLPHELAGLLHQYLDLDTVPEDATDEERLDYEMKENIILEEIEAMEAEIVASAEGIVNMYRENEARAAGCNHEIERLQRIALECEVQKGRLEKVAGLIANLIPEHKLKTPTFSLRGSWTSGAVKVNDEEAIPDGYKSTVFALYDVPMDKAEAIEAALMASGLMKGKTIKLDKKGINDGLRNGVEIEGVELVKTWKVTIK